MNLIRWKVGEQVEVLTRLIFTKVTEIVGNKNKVWTNYDNNDVYMFACEC